MLLLYIYICIYIYMCVCVCVVNLAQYLSSYETELMLTRVQILEETVRGSFREDAS